MLRFYGSCNAVDHPGTDSWLVAAAVFQCAYMRTGRYDPVLQGLTRDRGQDHYVSKFVKKHERVIVVPLSLCDKIVGMFFRSIEDKDFVIYIPYKIKLYSVYLASQNIDQYGQVWVMSEGIKDAMALGMINPLSFAYLGSACSRGTAELISKFTNKVLVAPDNDQAGIDGFKTTARNFSAFGVTAKRLQYGLKDPGTAVEELSKSNGAPLTELKRRVEFALAHFGSL